MKKLLIQLITVSVLLTGTFAAQPAQSEQWHHYETDNRRAWESATGQGVLVAIIDTGIDIHHPDFAGRISPLSYNSYTDEVGIEAVEDDFGHGTGVAGIIAGAYNGVTSGVAPDSEMLIIKANNPAEGEFSSESVQRGIDYAVANGADIINMSFGRPYTDEEGESGFDEEDYAVILNAIGKGVTIIAAVGNKRTLNVDYPAAYSEVIAVSGTKQGFEFADNFSNFGEQVDISAPGNLIYTTARGGGYRTVNGTSSAAANVSGVAALIKSANPSLTSLQIAEILFSTATAAPTAAPDEKGRCVYFGVGIVNSGNAVELAIRMRAHDYGIGDALKILTYLAKLHPLTDEEYRIYDLNGDDRVNIHDALLVLSILAGLTEVT